MLEEILNHKNKRAGYYENLEFNKAMKEIMKCADIANQYIDKQAPWSLVKENAEHAQQVCTAGLNAFRYLLIFLTPVLPEICKKCEEFLNVDKLTWNHLNTKIENQSINKYTHVASRLDRQEVEKIISN